MMRLNMTDRDWNLQFDNLSRCNRIQEWVQSLFYAFQRLRISSASFAVETDSVRDLRDEFTRVPFRICYEHASNDFCMPRLE